jgi:Cu-Zn family superoxide dismutase
MNARYWTVAALVGSLAGCATSRPAEVADEGPQDFASSAADLRDATGRTRARASVEQVGDSLRVRVEAVELARGAYGTHIHMTGRCDPPGFESAGPHWNPSGQKHGKDNPQGMHRGDLPNLLVGSDGRGSFEYTIPGGAVTAAERDALLDADGAAVVIHAQADDFRTDPSGNSGPRIACGVLA